MTVGQVTNLSYSAAAGRVGVPSLRQTKPGDAAATASIRPSVQRSGSFFYNLDGDSAEISGRARGLSLLDPNRRPAGPGIVTNYPFDLPSSRIDWGIINITPVINPANADIPVSLPAINPSLNAPAYEPLGSLLPDSVNDDLLEALAPQGTCLTCESRRYVDQSDDASVSFQTPTKISPNAAGAAVAAHEQEHVRNEQARANRDDREIVSQTVTLTYDTCPECGKIYVSGGTTKTTSISKSGSEDETGYEMPTGSGTANENESQK